MSKTPLRYHTNESPLHIASIFPNISALKYNIKSSRFFAIFLLLLPVIFLAGCAANNEMQIFEPAGFWAGLWHGGLWSPVKKKKKSETEIEWEEIDRKAEEKVRVGLKNWLDETDKEETVWEKITKKVKEKISWN